ncbi:Peroxisomal membrane anchor protein (Pex14p) conserved region [Teratosphaeria destructans]|uniref:Peroxisomal membrane protein PEX14 n=1 Tax=Teratosphaeria destructans TaxID=418781 RepID=A0A9W7SZR7_9PEZI|nr:Peroxisomal membrane anchor protein (Pex14p) conserved region [Teratosphaeria destructans]
MMAGESGSKSSVPAWQRQQDSSTPKPENNVPQAAKVAEEGAEDEASIESIQDEEAAPPVDDGARQLEMVEKFLAEPAVQEAPLSKKRAFLESKSVPVETIDKLLPPEPKSDKGNEFLQAFHTQQQAARPATQPQTTSGPPIITYPEFLVDAHRTPPLITPTRVVNALYVASGVGALVYGASKYLVSPMIENLTESRHDFHSHTHTHLLEFNEQLSKIVSKVPDQKKDLPGLQGDEMEDESITSDPTELYHRDFGTQTSPPATPSPSALDLPTEAKKSEAEYTSTGLGILQSHLNELLEGSLKNEQAHKERLEESRKLRHYLDTIMYSSPSPNVWTQQEDQWRSDAGMSKKADAVDNLKKEIRGVKGVLLSARRFPTMGANVGVGRVGA